MLEPEGFRDKQGTIGESGERKWISPQKPEGRFHRYRLLVSWLLLIIMVGTPFVKINGNQSILFNVIERKFVILGQVFWPQDFYLFVLIFITGIIFIVVFTIAYGRIFCGWICPQTIFMEMVFRKIEYWIEGDYTKQKKLDRQSWDVEKVLKRTIKHTVFLLLSFAISNLFLSYIIGMDELLVIVTDDPSKHTIGLVAIVAFSIAFYWVFAWFREQVCIIACPYGRLQGVMLDKDSLVVAYDVDRGEPRDKLRKNEDRTAGDCIDCKQCVQVCPTGIDIRNGTQMECINCTACIDACDHIMDRIEKPRGLVGFYSEKGLDEKSKFFTGRVWSYTILLTFLLGVITVLFWLRTDFDVNILRERGTLYQKTIDGDVRNIYRLEIINKTPDAGQVEIRLLSPKGSVSISGDALEIKKNDRIERLLIIDIDPDQLSGLSNEVSLGIYVEGEQVEIIETKFLAPQ